MILIHAMMVNLCKKYFCKPRYVGMTWHNDRAEMSHFTHWHVVTSRSGAWKLLHFSSPVFCLWTKQCSGDSVKHTQLVVLYGSVNCFFCSVLSDPCTISLCLFPRHSLGGSQQSPQSAWRASCGGSTQTLAAFLICFLIVKRMCDIYADPVVIVT